MNPDPIARIKEPLTIFTAGHGVLQRKVQNSALDHVVQPERPGVKSGVAELLVPGDPEQVPAQH